MQEVIGGSWSIWRRMARSVTALCSWSESEGDPQITEKPAAPWGAAGLLAVPCFY